MSKEYIPALNVVKKSPEGLKWPIPIEWAVEILKDFDLKVKCRMGDMTGEVSAIFTYDNTTIRIQKDWMHLWNIYHGDWKSDPHWTGD